MNTKRNRVCSPRHSCSLDNRLRRLLQSPRRIVGPYIEAGDTVIDVGCGPGFFTLPMAEMVGASGTVIAVDLQQEMLDIVAAKISATTLARRVRLHRSGPNSLGLDDPVNADFILAYYMVHETPDHRRFLQDIRGYLKADGRLLIVEPPFHVSRKMFADIRNSARTAGFSLEETPQRKGGKSLLLRH